jgi:hypothetical protein
MHLSVLLLTNDPFPFHKRHRCPNITLKTSHLIKSRSLIFFTMLSCNLVGDGLRDALDPHMTER